MPALVHDGHVITESTVINEYIEDVFPEPRLRPEDPLQRARMRIWTKFIDEYFCPALSVLGWQAIIKPMVEHLTDEEFEAKIARIPLKEQRDKWRTAATRSFPKERLDDCQRRIEESIGRIEDALQQSTWVAGEDYTLADISCFAMMVTMPKYYSETMNEDVSPASMDWHARMMQRPAVQAALALEIPPSWQQARSN